MKKELCEHDTPRDTLHCTTCEMKDAGYDKAIADVISMLDGIGRFEACLPGESMFAQSIKKRIKDFVRPHVVKMSIHCDGCAALIDVKADEYLTRGAIIVSGVSLDICVYCQQTKAISGLEQMAKSRSNTR